MTRLSKPARAYILAAGQGRRLWPLTRDRPKSLVDLGGGATLLGRQLEVLSAHEAISGVTIVTGYMAHVIDEFVTDLDDDRVDTRFNPFFSDAGPIGSIWAVRDQLLSGDFLICNGDTLFQSHLIDALGARIVDGEGIVLAASKRNDAVPDDVRIVLAEDGRVQSVGKGLTNGTARSAGVLLVAGDRSRQRSIDALDALVRDERSLATGTPWHSWVDDLAHSEPGVGTGLVADDQWSEVDIHPELEQLRAELASKLT